MRATMTRVVVLMLSCPGLAHVASAQALAASPAPPARQILLGVYDSKSGDPIADAEVVDIVSGDRARTSESGAMSLNWLSSAFDSVAFRVRKLGYRDTLIVLSKSKDLLHDLTITLDRVTTLAQVTVRDSALGYSTRWLSDFEENKRSRPGRFFTPLDIRKEEKKGRVCVFWTLSCSGMINPREFQNRGNGRCGFAYFVNGARSTSPPVSLGELDAIEVYKGAQIPAQYTVFLSAGQELCAAFVFWLRTQDLDPP